MEKKIDFRHSPYLIYLLDLLLFVLWEWKIILWRGLGCAETAGKPFGVRSCWLCETRWLLQWSPSVFVIYCQVGSLGAEAAVRGADRGAGCIPECQWEAEKARDDAGRERACCRLRTAAHLCGKSDPFWRCTWKLEVSLLGERYWEGRDRQHLLKSIFTVLGALTAQRSLFSIHCRESVDPSSATNASICKMTVRNA